eukprot:NODE_209_length_14693_cov_0.335617.p7 type:complete len:295 gc:universal NODE_209_length_14693_cov_0.335617:7806-6922(-)
MNFSNYFHQNKYFYGGYEFINKDIATNLLQQSGLPNDILGNIWHSCKSSQFPDLLEDEFVNMMNTAQHHLKPYDWFITDSKKKLYSKEFQSIGTFHGNIRKSDLYSFVKSNLKFFTIQLFDNLYRMVDINNVDNITIDQFTVLRHIVDEHSKGVVIPSSIPVNILGNIASHPINTNTRTGNKSSNAPILANEYWNTIQTSEVHNSTEVINSDAGNDLDQDIKALKDGIIDKLEIPKGLKALEFDGKITYLLFLNELMDISQECSQPEVKDIITAKKAKILELEAAIMKEKSTML